MYKDLMPIGSVVLLTEGTHKVMICGRVVCKGNENSIYDYVACPYPEGIVDSEGLYFFNRDAIENVYFIGSQDQDELQFRLKVLNQLGELEVVDGKIVSKAEIKDTPETENENNDAT